MSHNQALSHCHRSVDFYSAFMKNHQLQSSDCRCLTFTLSALSVQNQLSGYLLRKFKNSNGWQKLWVVFTNFCLFFYKTHQVSWPILGCINSAVVLVPNKGILTPSQVTKVCEVPVLRGVRNFLNKYRVVFHFCEENQMKWLFFEVWITI